MRVLILARIYFTMKMIERYGAIEEGTLENSRIFLNNVPIMITIHYIYEYRVGIEI